MNIGIVGIGKMGSLHAEKFSALGRKVYLFDYKLENALAVAKKLNVLMCVSLEELFNMSDAVVVAVPAKKLAYIAELAIMRGKHVLIEKPMAADSTSAAHLLKLAKLKGVTLSIGYVEKFHPCVYIANSLMRECGYKPTQMMAVRGCKFTGRGTDVSVVKDLMVHDIYRMLMVKDSDIATIEADGTSRREVTEGVDTAYARIKFENGFVVFLSVSRDGNASLRMHHVSTDKSIFSVNTLEGTLNEASDLINRDYNFPKEDPLMLQDKDFIDMIVSRGNTWITDVQRAIRTLEIAEDIENKIKGG